ncbi:hypothetical protein PGT21_009871 [Puccinia graminis f. sp. tritici]|uniref:Uncharacterized protein n=1 Tax=Puccinia graminis f. sp. tritici TaxID=56615 RepID=A0A5B0LZR8_PUCGR|nr:hypothetical protein PGT21_009871 [Puccinia graminis f. sp. tritici]KAA1090034.1 hypothetical protein PGTUg99_034354 [Puccinia graminis f. sp. tritici]
MPGLFELRSGGTLCLLLAICAGTNGSFMPATYRAPAHAVVDWSAERAISTPEQQAVHSVVQNVDQTRTRVDWGLPSDGETGSPNHESKLRAGAQPYKPPAKPAPGPAHPPNHFSYFQFRGNPNWNVHHAREAPVPHYPVPYQHPIYQRPVHPQTVQQQPVHQQLVHQPLAHQHPAHPYGHPIPPAFFYPPRYETHGFAVPTEINTAKENIHSTEVKNNGKARKYVEIGDDEKHPHYKLLPDDLHPEYVDHLSLPADLLEGIYDDIRETDKVQNNEILKESPKNPVNNVENILESNQKNPEAMEGNAIHSEIQSKSDLDDHEQKSHIPEITSPSKQKDMSVEEKQDQSKGFLAHNGKLYIHNMAGGGGTWIKANKPNFKHSHSPKLQWKPRSDPPGEDI